MGVWHESASRCGGWGGVADGGFGDGMRGADVSTTVAFFGPEQYRVAFDRWAKDGEPDPVSPAILEQQARTRNSDRQKKMVQDTNKLVSLATDLKEQVEKSGKDTITNDAARKAEEIEKLAKSVRDRMKD